MILQNLFQTLNNYECLENYLDLTFKYLCIQIHDLFKIYSFSIVHTKYALFQIIYQFSNFAHYTYENLLFNHLQIVLPTQNLTQSALGQLACLPRGWPWLACQTTSLPPKSIANIYLWVSQIYNKCQNSPPIICHKDKESK